MSSLLHLSTYEFALPPELIATAPAPRRDACRLLTLNKTTGEIGHRSFYELAELLPAHSVLVVNNSKVLPARLYARKKSGGRCECLFLQALEDKLAQVLVKGRGIEKGMELVTEKGTSLELGERLAEGWELRANKSVTALFMEEGEMPLPPYILKERKERHEVRLSAGDVRDYQTVFAKDLGSVAAPTAGLHFTPELLDGLKQRGVAIVELTLHVGWGTFAPIRTENIAEHTMHAETFSIPPETAETLARAKREGRPIIAVGSTSVRALESAWDAQARALRAGMQSTSLFIRPGYPFHVVDQMITNFHLPHSSLLVMVSAFAGYERLRAAYVEAIRARYRFYSYGDAMWVF